MRTFPIRSFVCVLALLTAGAASADDAQIQRGKYLVIIAGCSDCHTPGALTGSPDMTRYLAGSDTGFAIPSVGVFVGSNLTPDKETGLGAWSNAEIVTALRTGKRPDGSMLMGVMPYPAFAHLTDADADAIAAFLKSLPPVQRKIVSPIRPSDKANVFVSIVLPPNVYNAMSAGKK